MLQWKSLRSYSLAGTLALSGCAGQPLDLGGGATALSPLPADGGVAAPAPLPSGAGAAKPVALLLPLTGANADAGQALANAAKLAMANGGPALDIHDTGGTPAGAATAANAAVAAGDGLILGPLTSAEARAVAPIATAAGVNMLAFTNDSGIDAPGVWALGITPAQQVRRVVGVAAAGGHAQLAALLPDDSFGHSLGDALTGATPGGSPDIVYFGEGSFSALNQAVRQVSDFADRGQSLEDKIKAAQELNTEAGQQQAQQLQRQSIPPPAFNALFIGSIDGDTLDEMATLLPYYAVSQPQVQFLGPAPWSRIAGRIAGSGVYNGALFAGPDPAAAAAFDAKYLAAYGAPPPAIANVAFDAAAIARLAAPGGYGGTALTSPAGFSGSNGPLTLLPDGEVERGLAVLQIAPGAPVVASPAPAEATAPTS